VKMPLGFARLQFGRLPETGQRFDGALLVLAEIAQHEPDATVARLTLQNASITLFRFRKVTRLMGLPGNVKRIGHGETLAGRV
jgi:hypothetical protein